MLMRRCGRGTTFPNGIGARQDKKKGGDLWGGGNFISNQSHDKIITERRGEAAGGAVIEEEDLRDCRIHDVSGCSLDLSMSQ